MYENFRSYYTLGMHAESESEHRCAFATVYAHLAPVSFRLQLSLAKAVYPEGGSIKHCYTMYTTFHSPP